PLSIPVTAYAPSLQLITARQAQDRRTVEVSLRNEGKQDVLSDTVFEAKIAETTLDKVTKQEIHADETVTLAFALPDTLSLTRDMRLALNATKLAHPVREWEFREQPITLPIPQWYMYAGLAVLFVGSGTGVYYLRLYRHPLVMQLSASQQALRHLPLEQLTQAQRLLRRTGRLAAVLAAETIQRPWLTQAISFARTPDAHTRCALLATRLQAVCEPVPTDHLTLFKLRMGEDFMLNIDYLLLALPP